MLTDIATWDTCIVQYNYLDEHTQAGRKGIEYASSKGISVVIMEPLRVGNLVTKLPAEAKKIFADAPKGYTPAQWAFKWLWNQPEITCVLSGMNSLEMVLDNINTVSSTNPGDLDSEDLAMLHRVADAINSKMKVKCTGCGKCMRHCPQCIEIPKELKKVQKEFENPIYKIAKKLCHKLM